MKDLEYAFGLGKETVIKKGKQNISIYKYMWLVSIIFQIISTTAIVYIAMFLYSYHRIYF